MRFLAFDEVFRDESGGNIKTLQSDFLKEGNIPIIDQGKSLIAGFTNVENKICKSELPVIIFGDHTTCFKFIDFPFALGADGVKVLKPKIQANEKFLFYFLKSLRLPDTGYDRHFKYLKRNQIYFPPLSEQKRIAEVLDQADALREKRRLALQKLDSLTQSIFLEMFGDLTINPKQWNKAFLSDVCDIIAPLVNPTDSKYKDLLHYGSDRIEKDSGNLLPAKTAKEDGVTSVKFLFDSDAILYSKIRPNLNKVALAKKQGLCSADMYPVNVKESVIRREFLWRILLSDDFLNYAAGFSNRANIPKINRGQFLGYQTILPRIELQDKFVLILKKIEALKAEKQKSAEKIEHLFQSLQQRAFKGELFEN